MTADPTPDWEALAKLVSAWLSAFAKVVEELAELGVIDDD